MTISPERLQEFRELTGRDTEFAMHAACVDYYCDCHLAVPELVAEVERLRAENAGLCRLREAVGMSKDAIASLTAARDELLAALRYYQDRYVDDPYWTVAETAIAKAEKGGAL